jgi:hypothetical protein
MSQAFRVRTLGLDLPALAGTFSRRLHDAGVPVTTERAAWFAQALTVVGPVARRRLYWTARGVFVTETAQVPIFDAVFASVFGSAPAVQGEPEAAHGDPSLPQAPRRTVTGAEDAPPAGTASTPTSRPDELTDEVPVPVLASDEEVLRSKHFDALEPGELASLYRLMTRVRVATPVRRTRRAERYRHGERIDLRRTLRGSLRTAGGSCCCATSPARWSPTRARTSSS